MKSLAALRAEIERGDARALDERFGRCREARKGLDGEGGK
jgi:hypothetical protein